MITAGAGRYQMTTYDQSATKNPIVMRPQIFM
jgi:hypothetical protein